MPFAKKAEEYIRMFLTQSSRQMMFRVELPPCASIRYGVVVAPGARVPKYNILKCEGRSESQIRCICTCHLG